MAKRKEKLFSSLPKKEMLQKTFGRTAKVVNIEMKMQDSVSSFVQAMEKGEQRASRCKVLFGD